MHEILKFSALMCILVIGICSCDDCEESLLDLEDCINSSLTLTQDFEPYVEFKKNKAKWECLQYHHYSYEFVSENQVCYNQRVFVEVKDERLIDTIVLDKGNGPGCGVGDLLFWNSIEEMFVIVEEAVDSSVAFSHPFYQEWKMLALADRVRIKYDSLTGLPIDGIIDYHFGLADDEYEWKIENFSGIR